MVGLTASQLPHVLKRPQGQCGSEEGACPFLAKQITLAFTGLQGLGVSLVNSQPGAQLGAMLPG